MRIFIDESGSFSGFHEGSLAVVAALAIPESRLVNIEKKFAKIRRTLPLSKGEVKGKNLSEGQVAQVVTMLARNEALLEATVVDIGAHTEAGVAAYKQALAKGMTNRLPRFNAETRPVVANAIAQISLMPIPLFLQAITVFDAIDGIIRHVPLYFAQRRPEVLGNFEWIVDGKDPARVTRWEAWWSYYARGALSTRSRNHPAPYLEGADYSHFARFDGAAGVSGESGVDLNLLLADLRFSSLSEAGLELVDILVNAIRRALVGNLAREGWGGIPT